MYSPGGLGSGSLPKLYLIAISQTLAAESSNSFRSSRSCLRVRFETFSGDLHNHSQTWVSNKIFIRDQAYGIGPGGYPGGERRNHPEVPISSCRIQKHASAFWRPVQAAPRACQLER